MTGEWTYWYENGQKMQEATYKDGGRKMTFWFENGKKSGQKTLDDLMGRISQQCWDRDGNECECGKYNGWLGCTK